MFGNEVDAALRDEKNTAGGAPFGNFHQYYQFNSVPERLAKIPSGLAAELLRGSRAALDRENDFFVLDVGCNEGDLIVELVKHLEDDLKALGFPISLRCLGIDIDPTLIQRALLKFCSADSSSSDNSEPLGGSVLHDSKGSSPGPTCHFLCGNIMLESVHSQLQSWLVTMVASSAPPHAPRRYDLVCCFSVTMWIHIHYGGDAALNPTTTPTMERCLKGRSLTCCDASVCWQMRD